MYRGTTPTIEFELDFDTGLIQEIYATFKQNDSVVLEKSKDDFTFNGNTASITLTQEETLDFQCHNTLKVQLKIKFNDETVVATEPATFKIDECYKAEVI